MGRSHSFAPSTRNVPFGFDPEGLNLLQTLTRRIILQKARRHTFNSAPTACKRTVSGSLSSPNRGSSHLSIAVLSSLSVIEEYLALRDGPRRFRPGFT
jgi:hypothetical protein